MKTSVCVGAFVGLVVRELMKTFFFLSKPNVSLLRGGVGWLGGDMGSTTPSPASERDIVASRRKKIFFFLFVPKLVLVVFECAL